MGKAARMQALAKLLAYADAQLKIFDAVQRLVSKPMVTNHFGQIIPSVNPTNSITRLLPPTLPPVIPIKDQPEAWEASALVEASWTL